MFTSSPSRNDLFGSSWRVETPPPRPAPPVQSNSPRTSSFFDTPSDTPRPAPALSSPSSLSRSSSLHIRPPPPPSTLSPLHQSPSLPAVPGWKPPVPPASDDIALRFQPRSGYLLGQGRYASVFLASYTDRKGKGKATNVINDEGDGYLNGQWSLCAAKRMSADRDSQTMGLREAFFLNRVSGCVNVVKLVAVKSDHRHTRSVSDVLRPTEPRLILVLEHAPLGTMDGLLRTDPDLVDKNLWNRWAKQTCGALAWIHGKGIVHADVKPGNLLLTANLDIRLSDFGSSLLIHPLHPPVDGVGLGTLPFSAPELVDPDRSFSFSIDIFALGATLYQCITGREPYRGMRAVEMMHQVRRGRLWVWEEQERLQVHDEIASSPYPSAWRTAVEGLRRGGSLRVAQNRPRLPRMESSESIRELTEQAPALRLWADWVNYLPSGEAVAMLLSESDQPVPLIKPLALAPQAAPTPHPAPAPYSGMYFLDGERVSQDIRETLRAMLSADPEDRPRAENLFVD